MATCPHCKASIADGDEVAFCHECGASLRRAPQPDDRWDTSEPSPALPRLTPTRSGSSGELLRSLLALAATRSSARATGPSGRAPSASGASSAPRAANAPSARPAAAVIAPTAPASTARPRRPSRRITMDDPPLPDLDLTPDEDPPLPTAPAASVATDAPASSEGPALTPGEAAPTLASVEASLCTRMQALPDGPNRVVDLVTLVANADGTVDDSEREALAHTLGVLLGDKLHAGVVEQLIQSSIAEIAQEGVDARVAAVAAALRACNVVEEGLLVALAVAYASFGLSPQERAVIAALAEAGGVSSARLGVLIRRVRTEVDPGGEAG